jgi:hypothetical protein
MNVLLIRKHSGYNQGAILKLSKKQARKFIDLGIARPFVERK